MTTTSLERQALQKSHLITTRHLGTETPTLHETFSHEVAPAGSTAWGAQEVLPPEVLKDLQTTTSVAEVELPGLWRHCNKASLSTRSALEE